MGRVNRSSHPSMRYVYGLVMLVCGGVLGGVAGGQESVRNVDQPGTFNKYLTPGTVDRWVFTGEAGQLLLAAVSTQEFDSIVKLVQIVNDQEQVLLEYDDDGSDAHLATRLPAAGTYQVQVHGYQFRGGGNYELTLETSAVSETKPGQTATIETDKRGRAWLYFSAETQTFLSTNWVGGSGLELELRDPQGVPVPRWANLAHLVEGGEYYVRVAGPAARRGSLLLTPAGRGVLETTVERTVTLPPNSAVVLDLPADGPDLALLELSMSGDLASQVVAPEVVEPGPGISSITRPPGVQFLPVPSKGSVRRFVVLNRPLTAAGGAASTPGQPEAAGLASAASGTAGPLQLQLATQFGAQVSCRYLDPRQALAVNGRHEGTLAVGGTQYFQLTAAAGDSITWACRSTAFDAELRLYDATGRLVATDDDGGGGLDAQLRYLAFRPETLLLTVSSVGNGGGGAFQLETVSQRPVSIERVGATITGQLAAGETRLFTIPAQAGQKWLFHATSPVADGSLQLLNAAGVEVAQATGHAARDVVLVHEFTEEGDYTLVLRLPRSGDYQLRVLSGK